MKRSGSLLLLSLTIACFLLAGAAAKADPLSIDLLVSYQYGVAGGVVAFDATVTNNSARTVYLNGDSFYVDSPLSVDDSPYDSYPLTLGPGDSYTSVLFNVDIPDATLPGLYTGDFDITGGHFNSNEEFTVGAADFNVDVTASSVVPEPSSILLLGAGLLVFGALAGRKLLASIPARSGL
jgi:hypothetical protein